MGLRGIVKDILIVVLGYLIIKAAVTDGKVTTGMVIVVIILLFIVVWFMLERVGILHQT